MSLQIQSPGAVSETKEDKVYVDEVKLAVCRFNLLCCRFLNWRATFLRKFRPRLTMKGRRG